MAKIRVRLNSSGVSKLMSSPGVARVLERNGRGLARDCNAELKNRDEGDGYRSGPAAQIGDRKQVNVVTVGWYAKRHNAKHHTLVRHSS